MYIGSDNCAFALLRDKYFFLKYKGWTFSSVGRNFVHSMRIFKVFPLIVDIFSDREDIQTIKKPVNDTAIRQKTCLKTLDHLKHWLLLSKPTLPPRVTSLHEASCWLAKQWFCLKSQFATFMSTSLFLKKISMSHFVFFIFLRNQQSSVLPSLKKSRTAKLCLLRSWKG